jgi:hypothetical protein
VKAPSPLLGFNNNVRHKGRVFHIQTEDSGIRHPHVITHLFADGGRILKTTKTSYAEHIGNERLTETVRAMMQEQHKAMFIALRDGQYDYLFDEAGAVPKSGPKRPTPAVAPPPAAPVVPAAPTVVAPPAVVVPPPRPSAPEPTPPPARARTTVAPPAPPVVPPPPRPSAPESAPPVIVRSTSREGARLRELAERTTNPSSLPASRFAPTEPARRAVDVPIHVAPDNAASARRRGTSRPTLDVDPGAIHGVGSGEPSIDMDLDALERAAAEANTPFYQHIEDLPPPPATVLGSKRAAGGYSVRTSPPPAAASIPRHDPSLSPRMTPPTPIGGAPSPGRYAPSRPASIFATTRPPDGASIFGEDLISEKSLDEVILGYLAEDLDGAVDKK